jgi:hypothetical protein
MEGSLTTGDCSNVGITYTIWLNNGLTKKSLEINTLLTITILFLFLFFNLILNSLRIFIFSLFPIGWLFLSLFPIGWLPSKRCQQNWLYTSPRLRGRLLCIFMIVAGKSFVYYPHHGGCSVFS